MSFNGSGLFNVNTSGQPVVAGTTITSAAFNALTADLATGLSTAICKDGQTTVTANIPLNSFKLTGLGAGTLTGDAARMSQLQSGASQLLTSLTGTDTLAATILPTLTAYATGNVFTFVAGNTNTTAVTLNIDALGAKAVTRDGSTALIAGDIVAGTTYQVMYDGTRFQLFNASSLTNPVISGNLTLSGGTANGVGYLNASKVLTTGSVFTYSANGNLVVGVPTTGTALAVTGTSGTYAVDITSTNTSINNRALNVYNSAATSTTALTNHIVRLASNGSGADCTLQMTDSVANNGYIGMKSGALNFGANTTTTQMTLDTSGNLGIGTNSPAYKLDVNGVANFAANVGHRVGTALFFAGTGASSGLNYLYTNTTAMAWRNAADSAELMRLDNSGNLGIGTSSPTNKLQVSGAVYASSDGSSVSYYVAAGGAIRTIGTGALYIDTATTTGTEIVFRPATTERMRLDSSGNLLVGTTSQLGSVTARGVFVGGSNLLALQAGNGSVGAYMTNTSGTGNWQPFSFCNTGTSFSQIGSITCTAAATAYNTSSDYRLKNITGPITNSGAYIDSLKPVEGTWKADGSTFVGLIAHEVQEASRTVVATGIKDGEEMQGMDYSSAELIANLIAEIQSLRVRLNSLENK